MDASGRRPVDEARFWSGLVEAAPDVLIESLLAAPESPEALVQLAAHVAARGDEARAASYYAALVERHPRSAVHAWVHVSLLAAECDGDVLRATARRCWREQLVAHPGDLEVLRHALRVLWDDELAVAALERAMAIDDASAEWPRALAQRVQDPVRALALLERALARESSASARLQVRDEVARAAYAAGDSARAAAETAAILAEVPAFAGAWFHGNLVHDGHLRLAALALDDDDLEVAAAEVRAAGATPGSPQLSTFGPRFELLPALLARGERAAVVDYLEGCRRFWIERGPLLDRWQAQLARGETPDFGHDRLFDHADRPPAVT